MDNGQKPRSGVDFNNSGRILTIRAKTVEKNLKICILKKQSFCTEAAENFQKGVASLNGSNL